MKKISMLFVGLAMVAFVSCKKDYTCECTYGGQTYEYEYKDVKKKDAEEACDLSGGTSGVECELK